MAEPDDAAADAGPGVAGLEAALVAALAQVVLLPVHHQAAAEDPRSADLKQEAGSGIAVQSAIAEQLDVDCL